MSARSRHVSVKEYEPTTSWTAFQSGVSLHAHTHHSRETMADIPPSVLESPVFAPIFAELRAMARASGDPIDFSTGWWHPPVTPRQVFDGEVRQIEDRFGLAPLVSVTDHDDIAANLELQSLYAERCAPISVEWTVP